MDFLLDVILDAIKDTLVLVPFLFVTYLVIGALELLASDKVNAAVQRAGKAGPIIGAILGIVPQCGFSAMGATLYAGRVVSLGTLVAVFLSTSDEMLPLLVAEQVDLGVVAQILLSKALVAAIAGVAIDCVLRGLHLSSHLEMTDEEYADFMGMSLDGADDTGMPVDGELLEGADAAAYACSCGCCGERPLTKSEVVRYILQSAIYHTVEVTIFIFAVTLVLGGVLEYVGEDALAGFLSSNAMLATFASGLVGLVPNCAASVVITQLYLDGALSFGPMMAGSLTAAGAGFLVLFRTNERPRENLVILATLYAIGVIAGLTLLAAGV